MTFLLGLQDHLFSEEGIKGPIQSLAFVTENLVSPRELLLEPCVVIKGKRKVGTGSLPQVSDCGIPAELNAECIFLGGVGCEVDLKFPEVNLDNDTSVRSLDSLPYNGRLQQSKPANEVIKFVISLQNHGCGRRKRGGRGFTS